MNGYRGDDILNRTMRSPEWMAAQMLNKPKGAGPPEFNVCILVLTHLGDWIYIYGLHDASAIALGLDTVNTISPGCGEFGLIVYADNTSYVVRTIKVRKHRGSLVESMETAAEIPATQEALAAYFEVDGSELVIHPNGVEDTRIDWPMSYLVANAGDAVGFCSGYVNKNPA